MNITQAAFLAVWGPPGPPGAAGFRETAASGTGEAVPVLETGRRHELDTTADDRKADRIELSGDSPGSVSTVRFLLGAVPPGIWRLPAASGVAAPVNEGVPAPDSGPLGVLATGSQAALAAPLTSPAGAFAMQASSVPGSLPRPNLGGSPVTVTEQKSAEGAATLPRIAAPRPNLAGSPDPSSDVADKAGSAPQPGVPTPRPNLGGGPEATPRPNLGGAPQHGVPTPRLNLGGGQTAAADVAGGAPTPRPNLGGGPEATPRPNLGAAPQPGVPSPRPNLGGGPQPAPQPDLGSGIDNVPRPNLGGTAVAFEAPKPGGSPPPQPGVPTPRPNLGGGLEATPRPNLGGAPVSVSEHKSTPDEAIQPGVPTPRPNLGGGLEATPRPNLGGAPASVSEYKSAPDEAIQPGVPTPRPNLGGGLEATPRPNLGSGAESTPRPNLGGAPTVDVPSAGLSEAPQPGVPTPRPNLGGEPEGAPRPNLGNGAASVPRPNLGGTTGQIPQPGVPTPRPNLGGGPAGMPLQNLVGGAGAAPHPSLGDLQEDGSASEGAAVPQRAEPSPRPNLQGGPQATPRPNLGEPAVGWRSVAQDPVTGASGVKVDAAARGVLWNAPKLDDQTGRKLDAVEGPEAPPALGSLNPAPVKESARQVEPADALLAKKPEEVRREVREALVALAGSALVRSTSLRVSDDEHGVVEVRVRTRGRTVEAEVLASEPAVRTLLQAHRQEFAAAVSERGFDLGSFTARDHEPAPTPTSPPPAVASAQREEATAPTHRPTSAGLDLVI